MLLSITLGDTLSVQAGGQATVLTLAGIYRAEDERSAQVMADLMIVDIATAQDLFRMQGRISHIDLIIPDNEAGVGLQQRIENAIPAGVQVLRSTIAE